MDRAHRSTRKVWICVDGSPEKTMLANCKACQGKKKYGAYYNAAAHLRRVHFNPKEKSRERGDRVHRRQRGGGDWPPMEELKKHWMDEIEEATHKIGLPDFEDNEIETLTTPQMN